MRFCGSRTRSGQKPRPGASPDAKAVEEGLLVVLGAERRAHHPGRRAVPVGVVVDALVDREILRQRLAVDPQAGLARPLDRVVRLAAGDVDDVERHAHGLRDHDRPVRRLALDVRRPGERVALRPGDALVEELLLEEEHGVAVLRVDHRQGAQLAAAREALEERLVVDHQAPL
jgi:hypothetical protein